MTPDTPTVPARPRDIRRFFDDVEAMMRVPFRERWATFTPFFAGEPWTPAVDVIEKGTAIIVKADLPGVKQEDIALTIDQGMLTIRAERKQEEDVKKEGYHRIERSYGRFERTLPLPEGVDTEAISAAYRDGVLEVTLPVSQQQKPAAKTIPIT